MPWVMNIASREDAAPKAEVGDLACQRIGDSLRFYPPIPNKPGNLPWRREAGESSPYPPPPPAYME